MPFGRMQQGCYGSYVHRGGEVIQGNFLNPDLPTMSNGNMAIDPSATAIATAIFLYACFLNFRDERLTHLVHDALIGNLKLLCTFLQLISSVQLPSRCHPYGKQQNSPHLSCLETAIQRHNASNTGGST